MVSLSPTTAGAAIRLVTGRTPLAADREDEGFVVDVGTDRWAVVPVPTPPSLEFDLDAVLECFEADVVWDPTPRPEGVAVTSRHELPRLRWLGSTEVQFGWTAEFVRACRPRL